MRDADGRVRGGKDGSQGPTDGGGSSEAGKGPGGAAEGPQGPGASTRANQGQRPQELAAAVGRRSGRISREPGAGSFAAAARAPVITDRVGAVVRLAMVRQTYAILEEFSGDREAAVRGSLVQGSLEEAIEELSETVRALGVGALAATIELVVQEAMSATRAIAKQLDEKRRREKEANQRGEKL